MNKYQTAMVNIRYANDMRYLIKETNLQCIEELVDMREQVLMWCSSVLDSEYTICTLPDGVTTDGGYCYHLAKPIFEILKGNEE